MALDDFAFDGDDEDGASLPTDVVPFVIAGVSPAQFVDEDVLAGPLELFTIGTLFPFALTADESPLFLLNELITVSFEIV